MAAITVAKSSAPTRKSKYIDIRYHHIQDLVATKKLRIAHLHTHLLQADALKKPLAQDKFIRHRSYLSMAPIRTANANTAVDSFHARGVPFLPV